jgi:hypothetical protein
MTTLTVASSGLHVVIVTLGLGLGMANIMAPATESIMGSLPKEKAGVGSAMNDTTRQVGGAVGVALFGSILASRFSASFGSALHGTVPPRFVNPASDSVGAAIGVARDVPGARPFANQIVNAAQHAFVSGLHVAVVVGAVVVVVATAGVLKWLPARAFDPGSDHGDASDAVPMGIGPVEVVAADVAADIADELEVGHGRT